MGDKKKSPLAKHIDKVGADVVKDLKDSGLKGSGKLRISAEIKKEDFNTGKMEDPFVGSHITISRETRILAEASVLGGLLARNGGSIDVNVKLARDIVQAHLVGGCDVS